MCILFSGLIAFDTEYQDPEMFVSGSPKVDARPMISHGSKAGSFIVKQPSVNSKPALRLTQSTIGDLSTKEVNITFCIIYKLSY